MFETSVVVRHTFQSPPGEEQLEGRERRSLCSPIFKYVDEYKNNLHCDSGGERNPMKSF